MQEGLTERIVGYVLHDPIANTEGYIAEYDAEKLQHAEDSGAIFLAVYDSGRREIVKAAEIEDPAVSFQVVAPAYVDVRMEAAADVFDALQALLLPEAAALTYDAYAASSARDPAEAFKEALARFKALSLGGDAA